MPLQLAFPVADNDHTPRLRVGTPYSFFPTASTNIQTFRTKRTSHKDFASTVTDPSCSASFESTQSPDSVRAEVTHQILPTSAARRSYHRYDAPPERLRGIDTPRSSTLPFNTNTTLQNPSARPPNPTTTHLGHADLLPSSDATKRGIAGIHAETGSGRSEPTNTFLRLRNGVPASPRPTVAAFTSISAKRSKRDPRNHKHTAYLGHAESTRGTMR
ncbi:hypothetical protein C8R43DRAFT_575177 [Mycena crocata]|nr:hypothetical protein C8R43DRAFT_575177 [Mycena crocata]